MSCVADDARGVACHDGVVRHVARDERAGTDDRTHSDRDLGEDRGIAADRRAATYAGPQNLPIRFGLKIALSGCGARVTVICEHDAVPHEDLVLDLDPLADEAVRGDLAVLADRRV